MHNLYICIAKLENSGIQFRQYTSKRFCQYQKTISAIQVSDLVNTSECTFSKILAGLRLRSTILKTWVLDICQESRIKKSLLQKYPFKKLTIDGKRARKVERYIERKKEVLRKINR